MLSDCLLRWQSCHHDRSIALLHVWTAFPVVSQLQDGAKQALLCVCDYVSC